MSFYQIEALLETHSHALGSIEVMTILRYLHNFVSKRFREGHEHQWAIQSHKLNKISLKRGLIALKGEITPNNFSNIVNIAAGAKDLEWAHAFILEHQHFLHENFRDESVALAYAIIACEQKEYKKVIETLENKPPRLLPNTVRANTLLLRSFYELDPNDEQIMERCLGFESYLQRHRSPKMEYIEAVFSFLRLFKMLLTGKLSKDQLLNKIETSPNLYHRSWLMEKVKEYKVR